MYRSRVYYSNQPDYVRFSEQCCHLLMLIYQKIELKLKIIYKKNYKSIV